MGQITDQLSRGIARELRIGVERDDVADRGQNRGIADDVRKRIDRPASKVGVQLLELAALPFVSHEETFVGIPGAPPVEQEKHRPQTPAVLGIQRPDPRADQRQQHIVAGHRAARCVVEVRQEREEQVRISIPEITDLQRLQHRGDAGRISQQRRDHDQGAVRGGDPLREIESRQPPRRHDPRHEQVHDRHGKSRQGDESRSREEPDRKSPREKRREFEASGPRGRGHHQHDGRQINRELSALTQTFPRAAQGEARARRPFEHAPSAVHQNVTDVGLAMRPAEPARGGAGEAHRFARHLQLAQAAA